MPAPADSLRIPRPFDPARAERVFEALAGEGLAVPALARPLLEAAFGNSAFLGRLALRERETLARFLADGPEPILRDAEALALATADIAGAMTDLRTAKRRAALAIALADIGGAWSVDRTMAALSRFADACVRGALRNLLSAAAAEQGIVEADGAVLERSTGLTVLAMGKYGAFELNYSSDIDLIVFYDAAIFPFRKRDDARGAAVDIARGLVRLLSEVTADGYVFRVDLRLRPDAGATQIAISTDAALAYYEELGQNWERAAMIKARACAGDPRVGAEFLKEVAPFLWRRSLDFAAIEDIHSIKRQIHAHGGHGEIAMAGHNIKLGRGGIREIEFFVQTQELILGGRAPDLRVPGTLAALDALAARGLIAGQTAVELQVAYRYLRMLEHRLQMIEDEQTHSVPKSAEGLAHVACFMGYETAEAFAIALTATLETVQGHYARLFETAPDLAAPSGSLVFTGVEDDPETLATLSGMGFRDASHVAGAIRGWHHGRIRAMRSARARELLTRLMPALLASLGASVDPDSAFAQFDRFLSNLPSGVQLFSMFVARPEFLRLLTEVVGSAPRLASHLARSPGTLDALLDPDFLASLPSRAALDTVLDAQLAGAMGYEAVLDAARRFAREQIFRVGVQIVRGTVEAGEAGPAFARIAESVVSGLLPRVETELAESAGRVPDGEFAVVALGKLGGCEMTAASDLDLVFVYEAPQAAEQSDGPKPISVSTYYARLAQRLIAALTAPTAAGTLYEVDMRLRPTGNKGPVAVSLESFRRYHETESWTWERMALTRARVIAGGKGLRPRVEAVVRAALAAKPDAAVLADARDMRERLAAQFPGHNRWDLKFAPGGLVDIEFIAQAFQLLGGGVFDTNTIAALEKLGEAGAIGAQDVALLIEAARFEQALAQILRIALDATLEPESATPGLKSLLVRAGFGRAAGNTADFAALEARLDDLQKTVRALFNRLVAADLPEPSSRG